MDSETKLHLAVREYKAPSAVNTVFGDVEPYILCGVTAAGKNVLERYLVVHGPFEKVVTHTTREPRQGEVDGKDYWFVSNEQMLKLVEQRAFIEMELIHEYCYGVSVEAVQKVVLSGKHPTVNVDVNGAAALTKIISGVRPIFLIPPSFDVWMQRLGARNRISDGERERRMHSAKTELETALDNPSFIILANDDVSRTGRAVIDGFSSNEMLQRPQRLAAQELLEYIKNQ